MIFPREQTHSFLAPVLFCSEAVAQTCSVKKVFLEISQNSHENTSARVSFLIKLQARLFLNKVTGAACNFIEKETLAQVFPVNFAKFLRTPFLQNTSGGCFCLFIRTLFNIYQKYEIRTISKKLLLNIKFLLYKKHFFSSYTKKFSKCFSFETHFHTHFWYCM